jgi:3D (Asp-Asp-Asp) domain-containing protein
MRTSPIILIILASAFPTGFVQAARAVAPFHRPAAPGLRKEHDAKTTKRRMEPVDKVDTGLQRDKTLCFQRNCKGYKAKVQKTGQLANSRSSRRCPLPVANSTVSQYQLFAAIVTAYCPCKICCGPGAHGITASGKPVSTNEGRFCAAPRSYRFGTMITIPGYGTVPVLDRGGAITGNRLDVYFPNHKSALAWGRKHLTIAIKGAGNDRRSNRN